VDVLKPARALYTTRFPLMGGEALVRFVDARGRAAAERTARSLEREARRIEAKFSRYRPESVLSELNRQAGCGPQVVDEETEHLIQAALDLWTLSAGRFDPTVGVLRRAWDFKAGCVPTSAELAALLPLVDARAVKLRNGAVALEKPGMELDLGGVGKEYAVDRVAELLSAEGVDSAIINFLGDVRTLGRRGDGQPWSVGVLDPFQPGRCLLAIRIGEGAGIATSGDYERGFVLDGVRYHHLLDATTGQPARGLRSVTVVAPTAFLAGQLTTAAFLLGPAQGLALLENRPGVEGALVTEAGELVLTSGMHRIATLRPLEAIA
jgi:thiamine biosynthesis lipoprotein